MRLFDFNRAPNPRRARMFVAEKGIDIERINVDLYAMEQITPQFLAINPHGTVPVLETDEGDYLTETVAIAHYLEQRYPEPNLMGRSASDQARVLMWNNIVEQQGLFAVAEVLRNWSPGFANRAFPGTIDYPQMPELIDRGRRRMTQFFDLVEQQLDGRRWLATEEYSLADISLLAITDFAAWVRVNPCSGRPALSTWYQLASSRPSATA